MILGILIGIAVAFLSMAIFQLVTQEARLVLTDGTLNDGQLYDGFAPGDVIVKVFGLWIRVTHLRSHPISVPILQLEGSPSYRTDFGIVFDCGLNVGDRVEVDSIYGLKDIKPEQQWSRLLPWSW